MRLSLVRPTRRRRGPLGAFTIVEMLITLGAGILIALALASMFQTAGETVSTGERLSRFNRAASLIERQMRQDFASITRNGFLVIRHEIAHDGDEGFNGEGGWGEPIPVRLTNEDTSPRFRRTDEIVFFRKGRFNSARPALAPGVTASGNGARVYYGHGARINPALASPAEELTDRLAYDLGVESAGVDPSDPDVMGRLGYPEDSSNEFASRWTLLRHVTVLSQPRSTLQTRPDPASFFGIDDTLALADAERQIGLQPAMPSVFRHVNYAWRTTADGATHLREGNVGYDRAGGGRWHAGVSGLLDIATTDLGEIRARVTSSHLSNSTGTVPDDLIFPQDFNDFPDIESFRPASWHPRLDLGDTNSTAYLDNMQRWMRQAFPGDSNADDETFQELHGIRMRAETTPPGVADLLEDDQFEPPLGDRDAFEQTDRLNDQMMLTNSNLAVRCSAFKVEWSFGQTYTFDSDGNQIEQGELVWYGDDVRRDNGAWVERYASAVAPTTLRLEMDPATGRFLPSEANPPSGEVHPVDQRLIHGLDLGWPAVQAPTVNPSIFPSNDTTVLYSYFGYNDPTYTPQDFDGVDDALDQLPWPWPKLVRVSVTLADENDPELEQTFQFVFRLGTDS